ncbi:D-glycero-alpha-D-manno-heptose 7-phosphate kinase [Marinomonas gallaica]|uniref:D-glycero-alpha-D-manno-heptose 7-phosphate kinase n=1 Tax=Marinomonas gallaica TaxID=1806667 RepID=A0A1C3JMC7_9GAMM|nr:kinase [Marinomonas gallaica]SBT16326.1 D-glycero-alpha-D-manno-heptose 7-phosphate kinase [Marinomonas gallaica]SBT21374.1 D-glycero-alpha-D-manno-heptose 7-phosphate kinase [Marinomonas gallaica]
MIITRTPFRVSLFGGGTDYPAWYLENGGAVLGTTIDKYCYLSVRKLPPFFEHKHRIVYSKIENVSDVSEIEHPAVRAVMSEYPLEYGIEVHHFSDLPARSGLGSSSAFTVGLINALRGVEGKISTAHHLGMEAIRIEQDVIQEKVGSQDQIWAAHGGTNFIEFQQNGRVDINKLIMRPGNHSQLNDHILLFFTGFTRIAETIAVKQIENVSKKRQQFHTLQQMALEARSILQSNSPEFYQIGAMLDQAWHLKRELADGISTPAIDEIYQAGINAGAWGGKLLGAGGGGFMMFFAPPESHEAIRAALQKLIHVRCNIGSEGSKIVSYEHYEY